MKTIKNYNTFIYEAIEMIEVFNDADILESIVTDSDDLLNSIKAKNLAPTEHESGLNTFFGIINKSIKQDSKYLKNDDLKGDYSIEDLHKYITEKCIKSKYSVNILNSTTESETFTDDNIIIKFFFVYSESELSPEYLVFQSKKTTEKEWEQVGFYEVNDDISKFDSKLSNKRVEIKRGNKTYIYSTSNSGNDWVQNGEDDGDFKQNMSNDDIKAILLDNDVSITILA